MVKYTPDTCAFKGSNFPECSASEFADKIKNKEQLYEVIVNDKLCKLYFDIDYKLVGEQMTEYDRSIAQTIEERGLFYLNGFIKMKLNCTDFIPNIAVATSHGQNFKDWKTKQIMSKYSIRYFISNVISTKDEIHEFVCDLNKLIETEFDGTDNIYNFIENNGKGLFDDTVYNSEKKMRCVNTTKPDENRFLTLQTGTIEQTIITDFIDTNAAVLHYNIESNKNTELIKEETHNVDYSTIDNEYEKLLNIIGASRCCEGKEPEWAGIGQILKNELSADEAERLFCKWTKDYGTANKNAEAYKHITKYIKRQPKTDKGRGNIKMLHSIAKKENPVGYQKAFPNTEELLITTFPTEYVNQFNTAYFHTLKTYANRKAYFELFVCKVLRPDPVYIYREIYQEEEKLCFYTQGKIVETFNHLKSGEIANNGEPMKFTSKWLSDDNVLCYNVMDFKPFNESAPLKDNVYNLFRGFNPKIKTPYDVIKSEKILNPFKELGIELCGGNKTYFEYLYKYLAHILQKPSEKVPIAFIIKGKQGTGKNVFLNAFGNLLGKQHYITSANPNDFFGDYAEGFYHKLLVNMNECEGKDTFDFEGKIKSFITEDSITLNRKFVQPITISNLARLIIFTNKSTPIPIDVRSKDRRYVVFDTTDKYLDSKYGTEFWKLMVKHFNKPEFIACLYDDLMNQKIDDMDWRSERPITEAYLQMCKQFIPTEVLFLENKINKIIETSTFLKSNELIYNLQNSGITGQEFYSDYMKFCKEFGFHKETSTLTKTIKSFYSKIDELDLNIIKSKPQNIITYKFDVHEILQQMKSKKWIDKSDEDFNIEDVIEIKGDDFKDYFSI